MLYKKKIATNSQKDFVNYLIAENNQYREEKLDLNDWIKIVTGKKNIKLDYEILRRISEELEIENKKLKDEFTNRINEIKIKQKNKNIISIKDIRNFIFCPRLFYLDFQNYINKNIINDDIEKEIADKKEKCKKFCFLKRIIFTILGKKKYTVEEILAKNKIHFNDYIVFPKNKFHFHSYYNLIGIPCDIISHNNNYYSLIKVKNKKKYCNNASLDDIFELTASRFLINDDFLLNDDMYLIYYFNDYNIPKLFKIDFNDYSEKFIETIICMKKIINGHIEPFRTNKMSNCLICGYNYICEI